MCRSCVSVFFYLGVTNCEVSWCAITSFHQLVVLCNGLELSNQKGTGSVRPFIFIIGTPTVPNYKSFWFFLVHNKMNEQNISKRLIIWNGENNNKAHRRANRHLCWSTQPWQWNRECFGPASSVNVGRTWASAHHGDKTKAAGRDRKTRKK